MENPAAASLGPTIASIQNETMVARTQAVEQNLVVQGTTAQDDPSKTFVKNMDDLQKNHPEIFRAIQESIFEQIRRENNRYHQRLIEEIKKQRRGGS